MRVSMNDFEDIERRLKQVQPRRPRLEVWNTIEAKTGLGQAAETARAREIFLRLGGFFLPLTAAALLLIVIPIIFFSAKDGNQERQIRTNPPETNTQYEASADPQRNLRYEPVNARRVLYRAVEEGRFHSGDQDPLRRMRYQYMDTYLWEDPERGTSLEIEVPREEVVFVKMETY